MAILLAVFFRTFGADAVWRAWAVPTISPGFADLRDVLRGIDMTKAGNSSDTFGLVGGNGVGSKSPSGIVKYPYVQLL